MLGFLWGHCSSVNRIEPGQTLLLDRSRERCPFGDLSADGGAAYLNITSGGYNVLAETDNHRRNRGKCLLFEIRYLIYQSEVRHSIYMGRLRWFGDHELESQSIERSEAVKIDGSRIV